jgi:hypothetical protein
MKKLLLAAATVLAMSAGAMADTLTSLGTNPTSGAGAFSNTNPGTGGGGSGLFADVYTFDLVGAQILTIAFATNTFASGDPQFIQNFTGSVVNDGPNNAPGGGDDFVVLGPELAAACVSIPNCQVFGGSAILGGGHYYLLITGNAGVDAGYGGNLSTSAETPIPGAIWGFASTIGGAYLAMRNRKRKYKSAWDQKLIAA